MACEPRLYNIGRMSNPVLSWLMEGDPSIRWQAMRDLKGAAEPVFRREQRRVAHTGWGAQLLALQDPDGRWASGIYNPKWTSTTYTMLLLRSLAPRREPRRHARLPPAARYGLLRGWRHQLLAQIGARSAKPASAG